MSVIFLPLCLGEACSRRELWSVHYVFRVPGLQRSSLWLVCPAQCVSTPGIEYHRSHILGVLNCRSVPTAAMGFKWCVPSAACYEGSYMLQKEAQELQILLLSLYNSVSDRPPCRWLNRRGIGFGWRSLHVCMKLSVFLMIWMKQNSDASIYIFLDGNE